MWYVNSHFCVYIGPGASIYWPLHAAIWSMYLYIATPLHYTAFGSGTMGRGRRHENILVFRFHVSSCLYIPMLLIVTDTRSSTSWCKTVEFDAIQFLWTEFWPERKVLLFCKFDVVFYIYKSYTIFYHCLMHSRRTRCCSEYYIYYKWQEGSHVLPTVRCRQRRTDALAIFSHVFQLFLSLLCYTFFEKYAAEMVPPCTIKFLITSEYLKTKRQNVLLSLFQDATLFFNSKNQVPTTRSWARIYIPNHCFSFDCSSLC